MASNRAICRWWDDTGSAKGRNRLLAGVSISPAEAKTVVTFPQEQLRRDRAPAEFARS
jgi:hypothetical protein